MTSERRYPAVVAYLVAGSLIVVGIITIGVAFHSVPTTYHEDPGAVPSTAATETDPKHLRAVETARGLARAMMVKQQLPGLSVAVALDGALIWAEGFGWADAESHIAVTPQTRFRLGAVSKPVTAAALALLHDGGKLKLDAPVQNYLANYPEKQWPITSRQLMADIAGVHHPRGDSNDSMPSGHCANASDAVAMVAEDPLEFQPGSQYRYSVWGWVLLSGVVEGIAGEPFPMFMTRHVFGPLGMDRTVIEDPSGVSGATAFHFPRNALESTFDLDNEPPVDRSCFMGAGAFLSTPTDLVRLGNAMLKPGFLEADTIALLQTPTRLDSGASTDYGLGWKVEQVSLAGMPVRMIGHRGTPAGGTVAFQTFPDFGLAIAVMTNVSATGDFDQMVLKTAEVFVNSRKPVH